MKTQLSSVDVHYISHELRKALPSARIDKAYQLSEKELKIVLYSSGKGGMELVMDPRHICLTGYRSTNPETPSGFAMQLRKNLKGGFVRGVRQHRFDRILELEIERQEKRFVLIAELFSKGNVILCDGNKKVVGLLERQSWKDRTLKVGQAYDYPPETTNPLEVDGKALRETVSLSGKKIVSVLATELGLGGAYAEEVCLISGIEKDRKACGLGVDETEKVREGYEQVVASIKTLVSRPQIVLKEGAYFDVVPFDLRIHSGLEKKYFDSFNSAVDEYFREKETDESKKEADEKLGKELSKLKETLKKQEEVIERLEKEGVEMKESGDAIYQNMQALTVLTKSVSEEKKLGRTWKEIEKHVKGRVFGNIEIEGLTEEGRLVFKVRR